MPVPHVQPARDGADAVNYSLKSNKISQVDPGVFFYWMKVSGGGTYALTQAATPAFQTFAIAAGSAVFDSNCNKVAATINQHASSGTVMITFSGSGDFYIGIKFNTGSVVGVKAPSAPGTVHYDFQLTGIANSTAGVDLVPKH
jgi:hypothetical protein